MAELRECPFCGDEAERKTSRKYRKGYAATVGCKNRLCPAKIEQATLYGNAEDAYKHAIAVWNERNNNFIVEVIRKRLHGLSYDSGYWSRGEHPRVVELDEIDDLMDEFSTDDERNDEK